MDDRWKYITPEEKDYLEKKYGRKLPDKPPTLLERWEKESEMYAKRYKQEEKSEKSVDTQTKGLVKK